MILIAGNNLSSIYLSAYLEKENIDYRRIYTQKVKDYTFYFNDLNGGMQKRVLDIFDYQMENNGDAAFYVRTNEGEYKIDGNFELFMQNNAAHCKNGDKMIEFGKTVSEIGKEWMETIDQKFALKMSIDSVMAKNFMKSYQEYLFQLFHDEEIKNVFQSLVTRDDISLNTAAGYLYTQVFDGSGHRNQLEMLTEKMISGCKAEHQIQVADFDKLEINSEARTIIVNGKTIHYDCFIKLYDLKDVQTKMVTYYVDCEDNRDSYVFYHLNGMNEYGMKQVILWKDKTGSRLDIYYASTVSEDIVQRYIEDFIKEIKVKQKIGYESLKQQYGNSNFAGWAFNVKENMRNPIVCKRLDYMDLSVWGNAHFTCVLIALTNLKKIIGGENE